MKMVCRRARDIWISVRQRERGAARDQRPQRERAGS